MRLQAPAAVQQAEPTTCPFCRSPKITTTHKSDSSGYWRCSGCGELWNVSRLQSQYDVARRWK
jgi:ribosomal protein L37AE/L43A